MAILPARKFLINKTNEKPISSGKLHQAQSERRSIEVISANKTFFIPARQWKTRQGKGVPLLFVLVALAPALNLGRVNPPHRLLFRRNCVL
ncbi:hypothetical protein IBT49_21500 [Erwinia sp. S63]|uniref:hypothetical protein n=1 Tax=Erwinia sp. S63 TaxID=2769341 RepID=UPI00190C783F|nr:hypothetical protein [Erwinia sp. S63]MBK0098571.1 hypothetical protein [Erwinia sp. S63]